MKKSFRILSIDGGGVRGVYPLRYLAEIRKQIDQPIHRYFDLIVGTSSGGITAIGLVLGHEPSKMIDLYTGSAGSIFRVHQRILPLIAESVFCIENLEKALRGLFGEAKIGDAHTRLCVPVVLMQTGKTKVLKTDHHPSLHQDWKFPAWEAACSTAAAPIYFETFVSSNGSHMVDGGVWAANPALVGICETVKMFEKGFGEIELLSIGTGEEAAHNFSSRMLNWGILQWVWGFKLLNLFRSTHSQSIERMVEYMGLGAYRRINDQLGKKCSLSDLSKVPYLDALAKERAQATASEIIPLFFNEVVERFTPEHQKGKGTTNG